MSNKAKAFDSLVRKAEHTRDRLFLRAVQLFSDKGYSNVGIRELCASVGIKESSFYNHFGSKEALLDAMFEHWQEVNERTTVDAEGLVQTAIQGGPGAMLGTMMARFAEVTDHPVVKAILAIIRMEGFTNHKARGRALKSMYYYRREGVIRALESLRAKGMIADIDIDDWTAAYFYGLIGILDEYVLRELAEEDIRPMMARVERHMGFFAGLLEPASARREKE